MRGMVVIIAFCLLAVATLAIARTVRVDAPEANIRSGPGLEYRVIDKVKKGELLEFIEKRRKWVKVGFKKGAEG